MENGSQRDMSYKNNALNENGLPLSDKEHRTFSETKEEEGFCL